ncbi:MAG: MoaD/ThiS family protein [Phycisphaerales bacterium]|nr:MoaD/ThiS family protein [Phycisphaerales bacterium]
MITVRFTQNIQRHVPCPPCAVAGRTVREVLDAAFAANPAARGYVLDDQGALRRHMLVFVNGTLVVDRQKLTDPVTPDATLDIMQALSGG